MDYWLDYQLVKSGLITQQQTTNRQDINVVINPKKNFFNLSLTYKNGLIRHKIKLLVLNIF
jgi:hypothetical protein